MDSTSSKPGLDENWTPERLQSLYDEGIPEDFRLDFKGLDALPLRAMDGTTKNAKREEIGKDVTAFANSDGGVIIYGIKEKKQDGRSVPDGFQAISTAEISTEQLAQIIASNSEPTLAGVRVLPVPVPGLNDPSQVCYVLLVPQSDTAHMAKDGRYYFRNESTTERMRDWQVRDAMNRRRYPDVVAEIVLSKKIETQKATVRRFRVQVRNIGKTLARHFCVLIHFPTHYDNDFPTFADRDGNTDLVFLPDGQAHQWTFSNCSRDPLFPGRVVGANFDFYVGAMPAGYKAELNPSIQGIRLVLYADDMPLRPYRFGLQPTPPLAPDSRQIS